MEIFRALSISASMESVPAGVAAQRMSFSSYPGELFSDDDLYMMDSNLTVLSTTNHIFNNSIFQLLKPQSLVCDFAALAIRQACSWLACAADFMSWWNLRLKLRRADSSTTRHAVSLSQ